MTTVEIISVSLAQYRLLGRAVRGEFLPTSRFRVEHPTTHALHRKGLVEIVVIVDERTQRAITETRWTSTDLGRRVRATRNGVLRPNDPPPAPAQTPERREVRAASSARRPPPREERLRNDTRPTGRLLPANQPRRGGR